jgi:hypothetical protein
MCVCGQRMMLSVADRSWHGMSCGPPVASRPITEFSTLGIGTSFSCVRRILAAGQLTPTRRVCVFGRSVCTWGGVGDCRQPFVWEHLPGQLPNLTPKPFVIRHNFLISNYGSGYGVDNDDGSSYFDIRDNVFYEGSGLKSDYSGHDKRFHGNLGIAINLPCGVGTQYRAGESDISVIYVFIEHSERSTV